MTIRASAVPRRLPPLAAGDGPEGPEAEFLRLAEAEHRSAELAKEVGWGNGKTQDQAQNGKAARKLAVRLRRGSVNSNLEDGLVDGDDETCASP